MKSHWNHETSWKPSATAIPTSTWHFFPGKKMQTSGPTFTTIRVLPCPLRHGLGMFLANVFNLSTWKSSRNSKMKKSGGFSHWTFRILIFSRRFSWISMVIGVGLGMFRGFWWGTHIHVTAYLMVGYQGIFRLESCNGTTFPMGKSPICRSFFRERCLITGDRRTTIWQTCQVFLNNTTSINLGLSGDIGQSMRIGNKPRQIQINTTGASKCCSIVHLVLVRFSICRPEPGSGSIWSFSPWNPRGCKSRNIGDSWDAALHQMGPDCSRIGAPKLGWYRGFCQKIAMKVVNLC